MDNAAAKKNAPDFLKTPAKATPTTKKKGKPPGLSKTAMAEVIENAGSEEESEGEEVVPLQSRPKASHGRTFQGKSFLPNA